MQAAVDDGDSATLKRVIEAGGDLNERDAFQATPLHWSCAHGKTQCAKLLLAAKANMEAEDNEGQRPLHYACRYGSDTSCAKMLLEAGCELNVPDVNKRMPLHFACSKSSRAGGALDIVRLLLDAGANTAARDKYDTTPRGGAEERGHVEVIKVLDQHTGGPPEDAALQAVPTSSAAAPGCATATRPSATAKLVAATAGYDMAVLQQALVEATEAGVDDAVLVAAVRRMAALQPASAALSTSTPSSPSLASLSWAPAAAAIVLVAAAAGTAAALSRRPSIARV